MDKFNVGIFTIKMPKNKQKISKHKTNFNYLLNKKLFYSNILNQKLMSLIFELLLISLEMQKRNSYEDLLV